MTMAFSDIDTNWPFSIYMCQAKKRIKQFDIEYQTVL
jgi:hypothetical protein